MRYNSAAFEEFVSGKAILRKFTSANPMKRRATESGQGKRPKPPERPVSRHRVCDLRARRTHPTSFKIHGRSRIGGANFRRNIRSLPASTLSMNRMGESSRSYSGGILRNATSQGSSHSRSQTQSSDPRPQASGSRAGYFSSGGTSVQSGVAPRQSRPATATSTSTVSSPQHLRPGPGARDEGAGPSGEQNNLDRSPEPIPGPSGQRNISHLVINHIKADKKFQANVQTLIAEGNTNINRALVNESASIEPVNEEMDWETSEQEVMIEHIKSIRKNLDTATDLSSEFALHVNNFFQRLTDNVLLVLDTNIFISCLPFVREVRDSYLPDLGLPSIFIPWLVLRELDHLKISTIEQLAKSAIRAIRYINDTFSSNHPRVNGQSFEDFCLMKNAACDSTDDEILNVCMHLKIADNQRRIMLITNDKNLESKAMVSGVETYSKQKFVETIVNKSRPVGNGAIDQTLIVKYTLYPKLKVLMKIALEMIVESELKKAFGNDWLRVVFRKPPWNLINVFDCILKHWRSVFTFTFERELYSVFQDVRKKFLAEEEVPGKGAKFSVMAQTSVELLESIRHQIYRKVSASPEYIKLVENLTVALHEIDLLQQVEKKLNQEQLPTVQVQVPVPPPTFNPVEVEDVPIAEPPSPEQSREEVKALFQIIWNQVQCFNTRVNESVANYGSEGPDVLQIKFQFPEVVFNLQYLILHLEKLVSMEPEEIIQSSQLIIDFTNFLIGLNVIPPESLNIEALLKNVGFFCCDEESRGILRVLVRDLNHFGIQILEGLKRLGFF